MFTFARSLVKNKVVILALLLAGYLAFSGNKEPPKPKNAWDTVAAAPAGGGAATQASLTDKALKLLNAGAKYAGVEEYMPTALRDQAVDGFVKTEAALANAGKGQD